MEVVMLQRMYIIIFLVLFSGCASINSTPFQAFKDNVNYVQKAMAKATNSNQQIIANNFIKNANPKILHLIKTTATTHCRLQMTNLGTMKIHMF